MRVVSYVRSEIEERAIPELRAICPRVDVVPMSRSGARQAIDLLASLALGRSFIVSRDFRQDMLDAFRRAASEFQPDVVHIDHLQMAQFVDFSGPYRTVLDQHNVESTIIRRIAQTSPNPGMRLYAGIEWPKLLRYELDIVPQERPGLDRERRGQGGSASARSISGARSERADRG